MADIQIIMEVLGKDDVLKAAKATDKLERDVRALNKRFREGNISQSDYMRGMNQLASKNKQVGGGYRNLQKAVFGYAKQVDRAQKENTEFAQSAIQAASAQNQLSSAAGRGSNQFATYNTATYRANQNTKRFASVGLQQAGYQVGDFAVQLQGGTNAAVAFGQQGSQLLGIFGAFGAVLGAALAITTAIVAPLLDSAEAGGKMADEMDNLKDQLNTIEPVLNAVAGAANLMKEALIDATNLLLNNLDRVLVYATTLAGFFAVKWVKGFVAARVATLSLSAALVTLRGALIRTGVGALIVLAGELVFQIIKLVKLFKELSVSVGGFGNAVKLLKDVAVDIFQRKIVGAIDVMQTKAKAKFFELKAGALDAISGILEWLGSTWVNNTIGIFVGAKDSVVAAWGVLPQAFKSIGAQAINGMAGLIEKGVKRIVAPLNNILEKVKLDPIKVAFGNPVNDPGMPDVGQRISDAFSSAMNRDYYREVSDSIGKASEDASKAAERFSNFAKSLESYYDRPIKSLEELREAMAKADEEGENINIRDWFGGLPGPSGEGGGSSGESAAEEVVDQLKKVQEQAQSIADTIKNSMSDAFMSIVDGTKNAKDAFKDMARSILKQLYDVLVVQQLVGSFNSKTGQGSGIVGAIMGAFTGQANGGAWNNGVQMYANGGVVGSPTGFRHSGGLGVMGEAGPEAIMPLKRGKNGKLGVQSEGGSGDVHVTQVFNINGNGDEYILQKIKQQAPNIASYTQQQIMDQRRRGGAMKSTFGG